MLTCKQCGSSAETLDGVLKKSCSCPCGVIMDMGQVRLKGIGTVKEKATLQQVLDHLIDYITNRYKEICGKT